MRDCAELPRQSNPSPWPAPICFHLERHKGMYTVSLSVRPLSGKCSMGLCLYYSTSNAATSFGCFMKQSGVACLAFSKHFVFISVNKKKDFLNRQLIYTAKACVCVFICSLLIKSLAT